MLSTLFEIQVRLARNVSLTFKRFLYDKIDWDVRLLSIIGARGVGKTTMLLQYYAEHYRQSSTCLYLSADNIIVQSTGLYEIAGQFFRSGGKRLMIDEIHRYPNWSNELKSIYDSFPDARLVVSGSSTLDLMKGGADLSRRLVAYRLPGMSFREYLQMEEGVELLPQSLDGLLAGHPGVASEVVTSLRTPVIQKFHEYLRHGVYPFYLEGLDLYLTRLANVVEKVLSADIPSVLGVRPESVPILRRLIFLVASSQPFAPNIERMASTLGISREFVYKYLETLQTAGILFHLPASGRGHRPVRKPAKVYIENSNLLAAIMGGGGHAHEGVVRETFFMHQVSQVSPLSYDPGEGVDFLTPDGRGFEVGGRSKSSAQLRGDSNKWLAVDDTEIGSGKRVPLWLFGLLY